MENDIEFNADMQLLEFLNPDAFCDLCWHGELGFTESGELVCVNCGGEQASTETG